MNHPLSSRSADDPQAHWHMRLFVAGDGAIATGVLRSLTALCDRHLGDCCEIECIDIVARPELADEHNIVVVPTVIRVSPAPERRVFGDLKLTDRVVAGLGLPARRGRYDAE